MKKRTLIKTLGLTLPVILAAGCADMDRRADTGYDAARFNSLPATSDRPETRAYATGYDGTYAPPPGAPAGDWRIAEEIRHLLTRDYKLAPEDMEAVVRDGQVTLRGYVPTQRTRERLVGAVSSLPGIAKVNDQLEVKSVMPGAGWQTDKFY